jgi:hypothetical protein
MNPAIFAPSPVPTLRRQTYKAVAEARDYPGINFIGYWTQVYDLCAFPMSRKVVTGQCFSDRSNSLLAAFRSVYVLKGRSLASYY